MIPYSPEIIEIGEIVLGIDDPAVDNEITLIFNLYTKYLTGDVDRPFEHASNYMVSFLGSSVLSTIRVSRNGSRVVEYYKSFGVKNDYNSIKISKKVFDPDSEKTFMFYAKLLS